MAAITKDKTDKQALTDIVNILTERLHPQRIYLFGSRASGSPKRNSDYDIAIEGSTAAFREKRLAKEKLDEALGIHSIDLIELEKVSSDFSAVVRENGEIIYDDK